MSETGGDKFDYQLALRGVGAYLDRHNASWVAVVEMPDGFALRYSQGSLTAKPKLARLVYDDLQSLTTDLEWQRDSKRRSQGQLVDEYQNFFRALGWELRRASAKDILIEELEDRYLVTYLSPHPGGAHMWLKHMFFINQAEREAMLTAAGQRRAEGSPRGPILPRGEGDGRAAVASEDYWELGEREVYRADLKNVWTAPRRSHGKTDLLVTNRRLLLRFDGGTDRTLLASIGQVTPEMRRDLFSRLYAVEVHREGRDPLRFDCKDQGQMEEVAGQIQQALSRVRR